MIKSEREEERHRLMCEKVVNESWSAVEEHIDKILIALEKEELDSDDMLLLKLGARAFVQRVMLDRADSEALFGIDPNKVPCGKGYNNCDECPLEKCDYF